MNKTVVSIAQTLLVTQVASLLGMVGVVGVIQFHQIRSALYREADDKAKSSMEFLAEMLGPNADHFNTKSLQPLCVSMPSKLASLIRIGVIDRSGRVIADTDPLQVGRTTREFALVQLLHEADQKQSYFRQGGQNFYRISRSIRGPYDPVHKTDVLGAVVIDLNLTQEDSEIWRHVARDTLVISGFLVLFWASFYLWMNRRLVQPLQRITALAKRLGRGDFSARAIEPNRDEIGVLAGTFNQMVSDLQRITTSRNELERANGRLRDSEQRFRELAENIDQVFWMSDLDITTILYVSPSYQKVWGRPCADLYANPMAFAEAIHPDDQARVMAVLERQENGFDHEYRIIQPNGNVRWIHERGFPVRNAEGQFYRVAGISEDITERRQAQHALRQSDKLAAVGKLASGIAHEINNPLGVILGFAQAAVRRLQPDDPLEMPLKSIEEEAIRCKNLVQDLLIFSRVSKAERAPLGLNQTIEGALSLVMTKAKMAQIDVLKELAADLPPLLGNAGQLQQVVINLASNALDSMGARGTLTIKTEQVRTGPLSWICLKVIDTGPGIPPEILPRIFEPFFTTKAVGKGTGIGLSLVHEIVQKHSGTIEVQSRPGHTEFCVTLPVHSLSEPVVAGGKTA